MKNKRIGRLALLACVALLVSGFMTLTLGQGRGRGGGSGGGRGSGGGSGVNSHGGPPAGIGVDRGMNTASERSSGRSDTGRGRLQKNQTDVQTLVWSEHALPATTGVRLKKSCEIIPG